MNGTKVIPLRSSSIVRVTLLALLSTIISTSALSSVHADPIKHTLDQNFFAIHSITADPDSLPGVTSVRLWDTDTTWQVVNPSKDKWNWTTLDARVAQAGNKQILLVLGATPAWAARSVDKDDAAWLLPGSASPPKNIEDWRAYVTAVVTRYKGRIEAYQVWNEPFVTQFWRGTQDELAELTLVAHDTVKSIDPQARVVAAPFMPRLDGWEDKASNYMEALAERDWPIDMYSFHGYSKDGGNPEDHAKEVREVTEFIRMYPQAPVLEIWETEVNYMRAKMGEETPSPREQGVLLARAYLDASRFDVNRVYWYAYSKPNPYLSVDITKPEVLDAYRTLSNWIVGYSLTVCLDDYMEVEGLTRCEYTGGGVKSGMKFIFYTDSDTDEVTVTLPYGSLKPLYGSTIFQAGSVKITRMPVMFEQLPAPTVRDPFARQ